MGSYESIGACVKKVYHYTYIITNLINGKVYYGVRSCNCEPIYDIKYMGSGIAIKVAIKKYGKENFKKEIDFIFDTRKQANLHEELVVDEDFVNRFDTYNLKTGGLNGYGHKLSPEIRKYISEIQIGRKHSEETKRKMSETRMGRQCSIETRRKIGDRQRGKQITQEMRDKMSLAHKGKVIPLIQRKKMSESHSKTLWEIISPDGSSIETRNMTDFCKQNNLHAGHMSEVASGKRKTHKGYMCRKIGEFE